ncbi:MAG: hypothetical protein V4713_06535, partial [Pseudomonadota bacterium]
KPEDYAVHARFSPGMQAPAGACRTWLALYAGVAQFKDDLVQHIHLENNCLFPMFEGKGGGA